MPSNSLSLKPCINPVTGKVPSILSLQKQQSASPQKHRGRSPSKGQEKKHRPNLGTPRSVEKHKKNLQNKLKKSIEEGIRLKQYNKTIKEQHDKFMVQFMDKDKENQLATQLNGNAKREVNYQQLVSKKIEDDLQNFEKREGVLERNLKGLVKHAQKLRLELKEYKEKVVKAEDIIKDLKKSGNENMGNLMQMMKNYHAKESTVVEEITKLQQLDVIKDNDITCLDMELRSLQDFLDNSNQRQQDKIDSYKKELQENLRIIKRQDKLIVDLQQRNDVSQSTLAVTHEQIGKEIKQKESLEMKIKEINDQRNLFNSKNKK